MKFIPFEATNWVLPHPFSRLLPGIYQCDSAQKQQLVEIAKHLTENATTPSVLAQARAYAKPHRLFDKYNAPLDMMAVDLAFTKEGLQLIEMQAFSSILASVLFQELHASPSIELDGRSTTDRVALIKQEVSRRAGDGIAIVLDLNPRQRFTTCDFLLSESMFGLRVADLSEIRRRGDHLFLYTPHGELQRIGLIWNRLVPTELSEGSLVRYKSMLSGAEVQWIGHMDHFFSVSKASMPYLRSPHCGPCGFLSPNNPVSAVNKVVKPLYDFAGRGVNLSPSDADMRALKETMIWQQKVLFEPCIEHLGQRLCGEARIMLMRIGSEWIPMGILMRSSQSGFNSQTPTSTGEAGGAAAIV